MSFKTVDIRDLLFAAVVDRKVTATVVADDAGILAGLDTALDAAAEVGLTVTDARQPGERVSLGDRIITVVGDPKQVALGEERLVGALAKPSGIATAARRFVDRAGPGLRVVAGAWKKVPAATKQTTRAAIAVGGADIRMCAPPFVYLDKNYVTMIGGVRRALAVADIPGHRRVVQLDGRLRDITAAACEAVRRGADVVFVDSGHHADLRSVSAHLRQHGLRDGVELAFGGNVQLDDIDVLRRLDVDVVDVGRAIVDAPLLDMHVGIVDVTEPRT